MDTVEESLVLGGGGGGESGKEEDVSGGDMVNLNLKDDKDGKITPVENVGESLGELNDENDDDNDDEEDGGEGPSTYLSDMSPEVQNRIRALRKNQAQIIDMESQFYKEMHQLETKYEKLYKEKLTWRQKVVTGSHEPTDEEFDYPLEAALDMPTPIPVLDKDGVGQSIPTKEGEKISGIPMFWATVLRSIDPLSSMIETGDLPVLKHLTDVRYENTSEPLGFIVFFDFSSNEYFENTVLTKTYVMNNNPDPEYPFSYEGPEIISCKGCTINWKAGKDITKSIVEKRQKHKKNGTIRTINKTVKLSSFFHFFSPPDPNEGKTTDDEDDETVDALNVDFEIGQTLRERLIPRAILFFTGEALDDDDETDYATDTEGDDDDENYEESGDEVVDEQGDLRSFN